MLTRKPRLFISILISLILIFPIDLFQNFLDNTPIVNAYTPASGDILMMAVQNQNIDGSKFIRQQFSSTGYTIQSGDYLEYDVKLGCLLHGAGGIDLRFTDGTYLSSLTGLRDQNGVSGIPDWYPLTQANLYQYATNSWYHRKIKLPSAAVGKAISKWLLYSTNNENGRDYVIYYDNIKITNGGSIDKSVGYSDGTPTVNTTEASDKIKRIKLMVSKYLIDAGSPSGDVLKFWEFAGTNTNLTNKYVYWKVSNAGGYSYTFKSGDYIEYDVMVNSLWASGMGGIDIATNNGYFRDAAGWQDQNGLSGHPGTDLTRYAFNRWYHRKLQVPASMVGKTVQWWDFVGENDEAGSSYRAVYDNMKVTNGGMTQLTVYNDGHPSLNQLDISNDATEDLEFGITASNSGSPSGDVLRLNVVKNNEANITTGMSQYSNKYAYVEFSDTTYTIQPGDVLEYDVKLDTNSIGYNQSAGVDLRFTDNSWLRDTISNGTPAEVVDQNGYFSHPQIRIDWFSGGQWYHRAINLTPLAGKTINSWTVADECDDLNFTYTSFFDNIKITRAGFNQVEAYNDGNPSKNQLVLSNGTVSYSLSAIPYSAFTEPNYQVVAPTYVPEDIPVIGFDVTDASFGAVGDGITDDTYAFQKALYAAEAAGGSVVYAPNHRYAIKGHLYIPAGVTLRGDWKNPDDGGLGGGTILQAYENQNNENGTPFITMANGSTVEYLSVWYPNQSYSNVTPYPWTFKFVTYGSQMIRNVTMLNSYNGIGSGDVSSACSQINNVYGTILRRGIQIGNSWDIERWENVKFIPDYWSNCGLPDAPTGLTNLATLKNYTTANAEGIIAEHIDGIFGYNIYLRFFNTGIIFRKNECVQSAACGTLSNVDIDNCNVGIKVDTVAAWGIVINNSSIKASVGSIPYAVQITSNFSGSNDQYVGFNKCIIGGAPSAAVKMNGGGNAVASFQNCTFDDWGYSGGTYAIEAQSGNIIIDDCIFEKNAGDINLGSSVSSASICGNTFNGGVQINNNTGKSANYVYIYNTTNLYFNKIKATGHTYKSSLPKPPNSNFYNVKSQPYSATGDGITDDTTAIQNALTAAGNAGGGTVFLPTGEYKISGTLSVPANVELRGTNEVLNTYTINSRLSIYSGQGNVNGISAVTLGQNAGVRAVTFFYPNQDSLNVSPYPWTIRGNGSGVYVIDTVLINSYQGIDFGLTNACGGHYVRNVRGTALSKGLYLGKSNTDGWVENCHFNIGYWWFSNVPNSPNISSKDNLASMKWSYDNLNFMQFGYCANEHIINNFNFTGNTSFQFLNQTEGHCKGTFINSGSDGARKALDIQYCEEINGIEILGLLCYEHDYSPNNLLVNIANSCLGKVRIYGIMMGSYATDQPFRGIYTSGANVGVQQCHFSDANVSNDYILIEANSGTARFENIHRTRNSITDAYVNSAASSVVYYSGKWTGAFDLNNQAGSNCQAIGNVIQ